MTALKSIEQPSSGYALGQLFFKELLESFETLTGIADRYGSRTLADLLYLQNAILDGGFIDLYPHESEVLAVIEAMPSAQRWRRFVHQAEAEDLQLPFATPGTPAEVTTTLRDDTPSDILEMLLFDGPPLGRSREELEARFRSVRHVPYIGRHLGKRPATPESSSPEARLLGFASNEQMREHARWLTRHGSQLYLDWAAILCTAQTPLRTASGG